MRPNAVVLPAMLLVTLSPLGIDLYLPALPQIGADFQASSRQAQMTLSVFVLTLGLGQLAWGPVPDRFGRRPVALVSLILFSLASILALLAPSIEAMYLARGLQGLAAAGSTLVAFTVIRDVMDGDEAAKGYSKINVALNVVPSAAPFLGGIIVTFFDWRACFVVLAGLALLALALTGLRLPETLQQRQSARPGNILRSYAAVARDRTFLTFLPICAGAVVVILAYVTWAPILMIEGMGLEPFVFSLYFCANAVIITLAFVIAPKLIDRLGRRRMILLGGTLILTSGALLIGLMPILAPVEFMVPVALASCGFAFSLGSATSFALSPFGGKAGTASALLGSTQMISASLIGAAAFSSGIDGNLALAAIMIAIGALTVLLPLAAPKELSQAAP